MKQLLLIFFLFYIYLMKTTNLSKGIIGSIIVAVISLAGISVYAASALNSNDENIELTEEQKTSLISAIEADDFTTVHSLLREYGMGGREGSREKGERGRGPSPEIIAAIEAGDYDAWKALQPEGSPFLDVITAENFGRIREMHEAMKSGDMETAETIREELGLPEMGPKGMMKKGAGQSPEVIAAIESGDFETWKSLQPENSPMLEVINAENFSRFGEMHTAMKSKDFETATSIAEELGLPRFQKGGKHEGKGCRGGGRDQSEGSVPAPSEQ